VEDDEYILRSLLWAGHAGESDGHYRYGDDGELQCSGIDGACDFRRDSVAAIQEHIERRGMRILKAHATTLVSADRVEELAIQVKYLLPTEEAYRSFWDSVRRVLAAERQVGAASAFRDAKEDCRTSHTVEVQRINALQVQLAERAGQARREERERFARASDTAAKLAPEVPPEVIMAWLGRELDDFQMVIRHCEEVYSHFTRDRISKANTLPSEVIRVAEDLENAELEQRRVAVRKILDDIEGDVDDLKSAIEEALS
jgi:hypothetical protein